MSGLIMSYADAKSTGWQPIQTAPGESADVSVWVLGGGFAEPALVAAHGDYWRHEMTAMPGNARTPLLWHTDDGSGKPPSLLAQGSVTAVPGRIPEDEPPSFTRARQTLEELVPSDTTPMVYVGFLRCCGGPDNKAKADTIDTAIRIIVAGKPGAH